MDMKEGKVAILTEGRGKGTFTRDETGRRRRTTATWQRADGFQAETIAAGVANATTKAVFAAVECAMIACRSSRRGQYLLGFNGRC